MHVSYMSDTKEHVAHSQSATIVPAWSSRRVEFETLTHVVVPHNVVVPLPKSVHTGARAERTLAATRAVRPRPEPQPECLPWCPLELPIDASRFPGETAGTQDAYRVVAPMVYVYQLAPSSASDIVCYVGLTTHNISMRVGECLSGTSHAKCLIGRTILRVHQCFYHGTRAFEDDVTRWFASHIGPGRVRGGSYAQVNSTASMARDLACGW